MRAYCILGLYSAGLLASTGWSQTSTATNAPSLTAMSASEPSPKPAPVVPDARPASPAVSRSTNPSLAGFTFEMPPEEKRRMELQKKAAAEAEEDKPRNTIVRLPRYEVQAERPPVFTEKEINTRKGLAEIAIKRYLSPTQQILNGFTLPAWLGGISNADIAMAMYDEDDRLNTMKDLNNQASLFQAAGDKESSGAMKQQSQDMYFLPRDPAQPSFFRQSTDQIPSTNLNR